jgi:hypothetical protein
VRDASAERGQLPGVARRRPAMADPPSTESTIQWLRTLETGGQVTAVFQVLAVSWVRLIALS